MRLPPSRVSSPAHRSASEYSPAALHPKRHNCLSTVTCCHCVCRQLKQGIPVASWLDKKTRRAGSRLPLTRLSQETAQSCKSKSQSAMKPKGRTWRCSRQRRRRRRSPPPGWPVCRGRAHPRSAAAAPRCCRCGLQTCSGASEAQLLYVQLESSCEVRDKSAALLNAVHPTLVQQIARCPWHASADCCTCRNG